MAHYYSLVLTVGYTACMRAVRNLEVGTAWAVS